MFGTCFEKWTWNLYQLTSSSILPPSSPPKIAWHWFKGLEGNKNNSPQALLKLALHLYFKASKGGLVTLTGPPTTKKLPCFHVSPRPKSWIPKTDPTLHGPTSAAQWNCLHRHKWRYAIKGPLKKDYIGDGLKKKSKGNHRTPQSFFGYLVVGCLLRLFHFKKRLRKETQPSLLRFFLSSRRLSDVWARHPTGFQSDHQFHSVTGRSLEDTSVFKNKGLSPSWVFTLSRKHITKNHTLT